MTFRHVVSVLPLVLVMICCTRSDSSVPDPSMSVSSSDPNYVTFAGTVVSEDGEYVVLADKDHPDKTVRVRKDRVERGADGSIRLRIERASEPDATVATPMATSDTPAAPMSRSRGCQSKECRGLVEFCCDDSESVVPIGICFGIRECGESQ